MKRRRRRRRWKRGVKGGKGEKIKERRCEPVWPRGKAVGW